jgi:hypothetical protein
MTKDLAEPSKLKAVLVFGGVTLLLVLYVAFKIPLGGPTRFIGTVSSTGTENVAKVKGGTREFALVDLADGRVVSAAVIAGGPLAAGDVVVVLEQRAFLGPPAYQVVDKTSGP